MKNYSKQRALILDILHGTTTHPTVAWIYEEARKTLPKISLGTVYRNLADLYQSGEIIEVPVGDGFQHFDAQTNPHIHFYCRSCKKIMDCDLPQNNLKTYVERSLGGKVDAELPVFFGTCNICLKSGNN